MSPPTTYKNMQMSVFSLTLIFSLHVIINILKLTLAYVDDFYFKSYAVF